jgi:hypothetical protein
MKKSQMLIVLLFTVFVGYAQTNVIDTDSASISSATQSQKSVIDSRKASLSFGVLQGGGSLIGADFEYLLNEKTGLQAGMGITSFGLGVNIHFKPGIRSSYLNLGYWHQGLGPNYYQSIIGPTYVYRAKKIFTCQIGYGFIIEKGPACPEEFQDLTSTLLFSIGLYFPI